MFSNRLAALFLAGCSIAAQMHAAESDSRDPDLAHAWPSWLLGDHPEALRRFRSAAVRGNPIGQYNLAMMLLHGEGTPQRAAAGVAWLRKAARGGFAMAQYDLARLHDDGRHVLRSAELAARWYARAAAQGETRACAALARMFEEGRGRRADTARALYWYSRAAAGGDAEAAGRAALLALRLGRV